MPDELIVGDVVLWQRGSTCSVIGVITKIQTFPQKLTVLVRPATNSPFPTADQGPKWLWDSSVVRIGNVDEWERGYFGDW